MFKKKPLLTPRYKALMMIFDLLFFSVVVYWFYFLRLGVFEPKIFVAPGMWFVSFSVLASLYIFGAYDLDRPGSYWVLAGRQAVALLLGLFLVVFINYFLSKDRTGLFSRGVLLGSLLFFLVGSLGYRYLHWQQINKFRESLRWLFVVDEPLLGFLVSDIREKKMQGSQSFVLIKGLEVGMGASNHWEGLAMNSLREALEKPWSVIVVGASLSRLNLEESELLMGARLAGNYIMGFNEFYESMWKKVPIDYLQPQWFVFEKGFQLLGNPFGLRVKRLGDVGLALILFFLTWPLMLLAAIAIKLESQGPVFYRQVRTGKDERPFEIIKFRSMTVDAEKQGVQWAQKNDQRVTKVGYFLRLLRIDELPQLWNVLRGEMSFIGPRPERPEFNGLLAQQIPYYHMRNLVRPGISGWAQVLYPYGASVADAKEKLSYDLYYIKNYSILLDLLIVLRTIQVVIFGKGR